MRARPRTSKKARTFSALCTSLAKGMAERFVRTLKAGTIERTERPRRAAMEADLIAWCAS